MATFKFIIKASKVNKKGLTIISIQYCHGKDKVEISSGEKIEPKYWDKVKGKPKPKYPEWTYLDEQLNKVSQRMKSIIRDAKLKGIEPSIAYVKDKFKNGDKEEIVEEEPKPTLFEFMEQHIKESETLMSRRTIQSYNTFYKLLKSYCRNRKKEIDFDDIDLTFYNDFLKFMYAKPYQYSINTAGGKIKILKKFLNEATERGLNKNLVFRSKKFKRPKQEVDKIYLNEEELEKIYKCDLSDLTYLDMSRDRFIIGCYTGLRYGNFIKLKEENFIEIDGKEFIKVRPEKDWANSKDVIIPLHRYIKEIIAKYGGKHNLPHKITPQKLNDYLKIIGERAGIDNVIVQNISIGGKRKEVTYKKYEKIGTHTARRSFATNAYLSGIPTISIMKITGHTTEAVFMKYICITNEENALKMAESDFFK